MAEEAVATFDAIEFRQRFFAPLNLALPYIVYSFGQKTFTIAAPTTLPRAMRSTAIPGGSHTSMPL